MPGLGQIRSPFRFAVFVHLAVAWLCVECLNGLHPQLWRGILQNSARTSGATVTESSTWPCRTWIDTATSPSLRDRGTRLVTTRCFLSGLAWLPMLALSGVFLAENLPPQQRLWILARPDEMPQWVRYLRDETPPGSPVICLPVPFDVHVGDYEIEAQWLAWSMTHRRPLLNGYSGYFPKSYVELNSELDHFPDQGVPKLRELGAQYAAVDRVKYPAEQLREHAATRDWELVLSDEAGGMDIYRLPW
jgi:hypothetical protein